MKLIISHVLYLANINGAPIGVYSQSFEAAAVPDMDTIIRLFNRRFKIFNKEYLLGKTEVAISMDSATYKVEAFVLPATDTEADSNTLIVKFQDPKNGWYKLADGWLPSIRKKYSEVTKDLLFS